MPPSGSPVKEAILDNLQNTALALLVAGSDYYTTVEKVQRIDAGPMELKMFPAIVIVPLSTEYDREGTQGTLTIAATYRIQLTLFLRTRTDAASKIERMIRDVHKAVLIDRYRNANALNTRVVNDEVFYPTEDDEPYTTANVILEVDYRTAWNDLNSPT
tara:strand:+ start:216 stop:692 length:477 start_codon:yes stop_codon:yes gene_type:complete